MIEATRPLILVCGSAPRRGRPGFRNATLIREVIREFDPETIVITGGARGPDLIAASFARQRGLHVAEVQPLWTHYSRGAGPKRNRAMLALRPGFVVAFWDGDSPGTRDMISIAHAADIPVSIYREDGSHYFVLDDLRG